MANIEKLTLLYHQLRDLVEDREFDWGTFFTSDERNREVLGLPADAEMPRVLRKLIESEKETRMQCDTTACIAGWAVAFFPGELAWNRPRVVTVELNKEKGVPYQDEGAMAHVFDLTDTQAYGLCYGFNSVIIREDENSESKDVALRYLRDKIIEWGGPDPDSVPTSYALNQG